MRGQGESDLNRKGDVSSGGSNPSPRFIMSEQIRHYECSLWVEPDGQVPLHPSTGQPQFIRARGKLVTAKLDPYLQKCPTGEVRVGISQPSPDSNLTHIAIVWGDPENLDPSMTWLRQKAYRKGANKGRATHLQLNFLGIQLHRKGILRHPMPIGVYPGMQMTRLGVSDFQGLALFAHETMITSHAPDASVVEGSGEVPKEAPKLILPGDPEW